MEESKISYENQLISGQRSRIKRICFYSAVGAVYIIVLSPSILPTYFYFKPETFKSKYNASGSNPNTSIGLTASTAGNSTHCNSPLIPQHLYNLTICIPQCGWSPLTHDERVQIKATTFTACFIAVISLVLILTTWCKVPRLWKFPHFIIVIMLIESTTTVSLISVGTLLGNEIFCSSKFLPTASEKATTFCIFEGALVHYFSCSTTLWSVAYSIVVAKGLVFQNLKASESSKWPFIISAAVCWLLAVIPVIIVLTSDDGYSMSFYANYCTPKSEKVAYYTAILPGTVTVAVGVSFLYVIIWKLVKERQKPITASHDQANVRKRKMNDLVKRLLLLMVFYSAMLYLNYGSAAYILNKRQVLKASLQNYFYCLNFRANCTPEYRHYTSQVPMILEYIATGIFPLATVMFLAANERTRRFWKTPFYRLLSYISSRLSANSRDTSPQLIKDDGNNSTRHMQEKS